VTDLFVSYASEDRDRIRPLVAAFESRGWSVWWDRELIAGPRYEQRIQEALDTARCVVVAWSTHAIESDWCRDEAQEGLERNVLVPVRIDDVRPPLGFRTSHTASLVGWPEEVGELNSLLRGVEECLEGRFDRRAKPAAPQTHGRRRAGALALTAALLLAAAGGYWRWLNEAREAQASSTTLVIFPFEDLSPTGDQRWLAGGMAEALGFSFTPIEELIVKQAPPLLAGQDVRVIGARLGAGSAVQGSIQRDGENLLVTARLVNVSDGATLWSARYERAAADVFEMQRDIATGIVGAIETKLGIDVPASARTLIENARYGTNDTRAYEAYRRAFEIKFGPERWEQPASNVAVANFDERLLASLPYYQQAVEIDPEYSLAFAGLGNTYIHLWRGGGGGAPEYLEAGTAALDRAIELDPTNPIALANRALLAADFDDWALVARLIEQTTPWYNAAENFAVSTNYIRALANTGRWRDAERALMELQLEVQRNPTRFNSSLINGEIMKSMIILRRTPAEALEVLQRIDDRRELQLWPVALYAALGRDADAFAAFVSLVPPAIHEVLESGWETGGLRGAMRAFADVSIDMGAACAPGNIELFADLGDEANMYACMTTTAQEGTELTWFEWTLPQFDAYRDDPRFRAALTARNVHIYPTCCPPER